MLGAAGGAGLGGGIGGLLGGIIVAAGGAGKGGKRDRDNALQAWNKLQTSDFDFTALSPPELQLIGEYYPDVYDAVVPEEFKMVGRPETYGDERQSLAMLKELAQKGETDLDRMQRLETEDAISGAAQRNEEDLLRDLARRGQGQGGDALRARLSGNQAASQLAAQMGRGALADRASRRMNALSQYGAMAGDISGRDIQREMANQSAQNRYNELWANLQTDAARYGADASNQGQLYNLQRAQNVSDANALNRYNTQLANLQRQNDLRNLQYQQNLQKTMGVAGAYGQRAASKDAERNMKAAGIVGAGQGLGQAGGAGLGGAGLI